MTTATLIVLLSSIIFVLSIACPSGYTQAANGGDCFKIKSYYDSYSGQFYPKTFDEAELDCNSGGGGLLTSIHSLEEHLAINSLDCPYQASGTQFNIGLKCKGRDCKWDDGSPFTYMNFAQVPPDDNTLRCYGSGYYDTWEEKKCGKQEKDCWICRVKAKSIDCTDDESEYKGGCASVHSTPLDQKSAEASCPGGGHLVSIHSSKENDRYKQLALDAGITGTIYIGGQYARAVDQVVFEWMDESYEGFDNWANWFPNLALGTCVQMMLGSEFGVQGQWTSVDCTTQQPYICFRDGAEFGPTIHIS